MLVEPWFKLNTSPASTDLFPVTGFTSHPMVTYSSSSLFFFFMCVYYLLHIYLETCTMTFPRLDYWGRSSLRIIKKKKECPIYVWPVHELWSLCKCKFCGGAGEQIQKKKKKEVKGFEKIRELTKSDGTSPAAIKITIIMGQ